MTPDAAIDLVLEWAAVAILAAFVVAACIAIIKSALADE